MKMYVRPTLECVEFKLEERLASACTGCCTADDPRVLAHTLVFMTYSV